MAKYDHDDLRSKSPLPSTGRLPQTFRKERPELDRELDKIRAAAQSTLNPNPEPERESVVVLRECIELQETKGRDYQNPNSSVKQAMHYRRGVATIHDMLEQKLLRARSLIEAVEHDPLAVPNHESLEDTYKDVINYASFAVSYIRGRMSGQSDQYDMLNRNVIATYIGDDVGIDNERNP